MPETSKPDTVPVYRIENPNTTGNPNGVTSHEELVGQWFSPSLDAALGYLRKSTQTFGKDAGPIDGAQLVVAQLPASELEAHHVSQHPIASRMDVEGDNYIVPRDGSVPTEVIPLGEVLEGLQGQLGNTKKIAEAKARIHTMLGDLAVEKDQTFTDKYLAGLLLPAPIEDPNSVNTITGKSTDVLTPGQARGALKSWSGYEESDWMQVLDSGLATHNTRAEIIIALSDQPRSCYLISLNLRLLEELDNKGRASSITEEIAKNEAWQTPAVRSRLAADSTAQYPY